MLGRDVLALRTSPEPSHLRRVFSTDVAFGTLSRTRPLASRLSVPARDSDIVDRSKMVRKGEYLERAVVVPHGDSSLDALYHRGTERPSVLIVPPHPDEGSMEVPAVAEIAWALARAGHPTLRFNYPGVAGSPGAFSAAEASAAVAAASVHLQLCAVSKERPSVEADPLWLTVGGGAIIAAPRMDEARSLMMVGPPLDVWPLLKSLPNGIRAVIAECDVNREPAVEAAQQCANARIRVVVGAEPSFQKGLVELGRAVVETLKDLAGRAL